MSHQPTSLQSLFAEMKRRRVFRVMAVYGAVAFRRVREWEDHVFAPAWAFLTVTGYGAIGELDAGFDLMAAMIERPGEFNSTVLRLSPRFDPYRDDPRFAEFVERRGRFEAEGAKLGEAGRPWLP